jgi:hypothetical protein
VPAIREQFLELSWIWSFAIGVMSISCAVNPARGITTQRSVEAVLVNWIIPIVVMVLATMYQGWWTAKAKRARSAPQIQTGEENERETRPSEDASLIGPGTGDYGAIAAVTANTKVVLSEGAAEI